MSAPSLLLPVGADTKAAKTVAQPRKWQAFSLVKSVCSAKRHVQWLVFLTSVVAATGYTFWPV